MATNQHKKKIAGYLALRLWLDVQTNMGRLPFDDPDLVGVVPVFRTKTAARKMYGRNVELRTMAFTMDDK